jgi:ABC-type transport system involved in multi-copper enzyme maturation permease subunit
MAGKMIKWTYIRLIWRNNKAFAIFSMAFITLFQFLLLYLVTTFDTAAMLSAILEQMPPMMKVFLQDSFFSMLTYDGAAAFGFNHPIALTLLVITAINIPAHHITRETETGTLELLLAHPFKRRSLIFSLWISGGLILLVIITTALIGSFLSIILFHNLTDEIIIKLVQIGFNLWLLILLIFSMTLLIAVYARQGLRSGNLSAVITFVFYLLYFVSQLWDVLSFTKPFNIFSYFEPQSLMFDKGSFWLDIIVLGGLVLLCFILSLRQFEKKDVP